MTPKEEKHLTRVQQLLSAYLSAIGRQGGKAKSPAKAAAARANGKKGGRPRKANK